MKYLEHAKLAAVKDQSQEIGNFINWLQDELGVFLAIDDEKGYETYAYIYDMNKLLAKYFKINLDKLEKEKRAMLDDIRAANKKI